MKKIFLFLLFPFWSFSQPFLQVRLEQVDFPGLPAVQSFVYGISSDGKWVILGGRTEGLHIRFPFAAFDPAFNHTTIWVVDPVQKSVWQRDLEGLSTGLYEQLQSSNMQFYQDGDHLVIIGGYGFSDSKDQFVTHPFLTVVEVDRLADLIIRNEAIDGVFSQISHPRMAVTGGQLKKLGDYFLLVGGQKFEGRYNPMGPTHGPGFSQEYTDQIRRFKLAKLPSGYEIQEYSSIHDETNLHRRDYNLVTQIFPNGSTGLTAFSGVFQHQADLPFLNSVDINAQTYSVNNDFQQLLNQYHSAHLPIYDQTNNRMHTLFFGGIGQFYKNASGDLVNDTDVPFVKTISLVSRHADGRMEENSLPLQMPGFLGASAEFIPHTDLELLENEILDMNQLEPDGWTLAGYIFGGIESTMPNVFFENGDDLSVASAKLFAVYLSPSQTVSNPEIQTKSNPLQLKLFPNPADSGFTVEYQIPEKGSVWLLLQDESGKIVKSWQAEQGEPGTYQIFLDAGPFSAGNYLMTLTNGKFHRSTKITLRK